MSDLRRLTGASLPPAQEYFPTRNDALNVNLGGGLPIGAMTEIYGAAESYKTTLLAEIVAEAQVNHKGAYVVIADREGRLNKRRLESVGASNTHERLLYFGNDPHMITIEKMFELTNTAIFTIRQMDCEALVEKLKGKPSKALLKRYQDRLNKPDATGAELAKALWFKGKEGKQEKTFFYGHLVCDEDRSLIVWLVDSITAMPSRSSVGGDKRRSTVADREEVYLRQGNDGSNTQAQSARAWSRQLQECRFVDNKVLGLATAQTRLAGFGSHTGPFSASATPGACDFYARLRIYVRPNGGAASFIFADGQGGVTYSATQNLTDDQKQMAVGRRVLYEVKKAFGHGHFKCPAFMIGAFGTDRQNSLWDYFVMRGVIKAKGATWSVVPEAPETSLPEKFTRAKFVSELYVPHIQDLGTLLRWSVERYELSDDLD